MQERTGPEKISVGDCIIKVEKLHTLLNPHGPATHMELISSSPETADTDAARMEPDGTGRKSAAVDSLFASFAFSPITVAFFNPYLLPALQQVTPVSWSSTTFALAQWQK